MWSPCTAMLGSFRGKGRLLAADHCQVSVSITSTVSNGQQIYLFLQLGPESSLQRTAASCHLVGMGGKYSTHFLSQPKTEEFISGSAPVSSNNCQVPSDNDNAEAERKTIRQDRPLSTVTVIRVDCTRLEQGIGSDTIKVHSVAINNSRAVVCP